ncbi:MULTISPECIES: molybdopterin converting factor subunit 1 [unclassified Undibacterium]|uniref:molybdopterin converting factor subunit 1 n=1 Tax=unclassified Undibacterium TaxID=2630295 RepID=UPI002AC8BAEE|nr:MULTISPECIES: molybdopterin converting factor subunit 1 [unclassified Undibacterium]MEB0140679.1 molybdopterin converting factor subunit 1 [Undibacterium sp. CCC2.1]MEB0173705.1 molybdopterin converting factor subunit 1 [Undibacterium sp. CCC1.1]MEB0177663.1 molybdopterin converting factor subunit 1 [Undibacterium sp. CCC3.4]MEB0216872.1 molybdopterin converting factor subunit 1 [Undibacterium sp. 5I2]WPX43371.1 molybdopterin converting factor subunit 1 [Undibacterium sp. CCC3.4]
MKIQLRFFASVRESLNLSEQTVDVPVSVQTVGQLRAWLVARGEVWAEVLGAQRALRMAYQQQMCEPDTALTDGAEVAFFPPVTGG